MVWFVGCHWKCLFELLKDAALDPHESGRCFLALHAPDTQLPYMNLDRSRLQQICINLISNAIHYTQEGGVTVSIEQNDAGIQIFVTDTGAGIPEEDQPRLFKKFATAKAFIKTKEYGSGLGLYIARLLANAMHCDVRLEQSILEKGTTFSLNIPTASQVVIKSV